MLHGIEEGFFIQLNPKEGVLLDVFFILDDDLFFVLLDEEEVEAIMRLVEDSD